MGGRFKMKPCVHGDVCRAYMRKFGAVCVTDRDGQRRWVTCILSEKCPCCPYYEPKERKDDR